MEKSGSDRITLSLTCPEHYHQIVKAEIIERVAEIIAISYKYEFFKNNLSVSGLNSTEREILLASLISADLEEDKKYALDRLKNQTEFVIDGFFSFRLKPLKAKWQDIVSYMPPCFISSQLKDFILYLLEHKRKRVYIDNGKVYDWHFRRLKKCSLLKGEQVKILREVLLSGCGEVEIAGKVPQEDERYIKEYYGDKIFFSQGYY